MSTRDVDQKGGAAVSAQRQIPRAHDLLRTRRPALEAMLAPRSIALIGASEADRSVGRSLLENLTTAGFAGRIIPVNPHRQRVFGRESFHSIGAVSDAIDLAVIATPASTVPEIVGECSTAGVKGAIVISAGFAETGARGAELEREVLSRRGSMRVLGPNCLGAMIPHARLNATFAAGMARPGSVAFLSQSGALCTAVLDWSLRENVGFSAFISVGSMADIGWGDLIYHLGDDPRTRSIVIYMESIGDARAFLSAAREVALTKPIIVIKVGRSAAAARAAASHTGALVGDDAVLDAAFRRVGVLRVHTIADLFAMAEALAKQPRPAGPRLAIVTNAGGPGGLATDALVENGARLADLSRGSLAELDRLLPSHWSHQNPVDILGDASPEDYAKAVEIVSRDAGTDGLLVILTPQAMTDPAATAEQVQAVSPMHGKPLLTSWMGGAGVEIGERILNAAGIPTFHHPDTAARVFAHMWRYADNLRSIYETPALAPGSEEVAARRARVEHLLRKLRKAGRTLLTERESMEVLSAYGIPSVEARVARSEVEAVAAAEALGFPVVVKIHSDQITHKAAAGGVKLNLCNAKGVRRAYREIEHAACALVGIDAFLGVTVQPMVVRKSGCELIVGSSTDPQFGPVLLFGAGGALVEVLRDRSLGLPPLTATLARRMMEPTRIFELLAGARGHAPVDLAALDQLLVRFSHLVSEQHLIREIDINPLLASPEGFLALDARVLLHDPSIPEAELPTVAIRPYPTQYISRFRLRDGRLALLRPIRPEDEPRMIAFHETLSESSVHFRYFGSLKLDLRVAHERLARQCFNDYDREIALIAEHRRFGGRPCEIIGVGRLSKLHGRNEEAEFAVVVSDAWQGLGLGSELLSRLIEVGREEKLVSIIAHILPENGAMLAILKRAGFEMAHDADGEVRATLTL